MSRGWRPLARALTLPPGRGLSTSRTLGQGYRRFRDAAPGRGSSSSSTYQLPSNLRRPPTLVLVGAAAALAWWATHLERVPETGRIRFIDTSPALEKQMGEQGYRDVMREYRGQLLPASHPTTRYVQRIATRITDASNLDGGEGGWECHVVHDDQTRNAFVLPGGKIFVFTGILPITQNEDGLAVVMGHEIAHQVARHSAERMSYGKILFAVGLLLNSLGIDESISRGLLTLFMALPNSRSAESEADFIGLRLATRACFDPREATALWQRMEQSEGGRGKKGVVNVDFLSTHPASGARIVKVTKWAKEMMLERPAVCGPLEEQIGSFNSLTRERRRF